MADFYKVNKEKVIFTGDGELIYYVPNKYFESNIAKIYGNIVDLFGVFTYGLYNKQGKLIKLDRFKLPTQFQCKPYKIDKENGFQLNGTKEPQDYRLLYFKKGDELISQKRVPKVVVNVENFIKLLISANLPDNIPYDKIHEYLIDNAEMNGFNYKISPQVLGLLISELYRDPKDLSKPFRFTDMKDMTDYKAISIKAIPKYTSPYTAITSENADKAIAAALTLKSNVSSPLEPVMMESTGLTSDDFFEEEYIAD